ncbi:MAG: ABC transporter ATP-binding protein [Candidatus Cloacimonetes bacterium]|nr:ABC transporter ATP-binding protein [Candidatus Cloacimonadota bacterium]
MSIVKVEGLGISFGNLPALKEINLQVPAGGIYGIIGPDSAGKTTLLRTICTLLPYKEGKVEVLKLDALKDAAVIRAQIGYMPQRFSLYRDLSVEQNIRFSARLFGVNGKEYASTLERLYQFSKLQPFAGRQAGKLSGGMQQKLALSCALIHKPELLVLDEPTFGVDPVSRQDFWDILHALKAEGISIIVSTPYMDEAQQCDRISLLFKGKIIGSDTPAGILAGWKGHLYRLETDDPQRLYGYLKEDLRLGDLQLFGSDIHLGSEDALEDAVFEKWQKGCPALKSWQQIQPNMEDVFLKMMQ